MADGDFISLSPVVVTGGCGFIGFHMVSQLIEDDSDCKIHVLDINMGRNRVSGAVYHDCDITALSEVQSLFNKLRPKTVFHVACPDSMILQPSVFRQVNLIGARNLLTAARASGVQAFINTSTTSIIHDNHSDIVNADETLPILEYPAQKRVYTLTKAEAHKEIIAANRKDGDASLLTVSMLPASTFGPRDTVLLAKIIATAKAGKAKIQMGPGQNEYDFLYVSNLVDAHILAARALIRAFGKPAPPKGSRVDGETFIITNNERRNFWEFQRSIAALVGHPVKPDEIKIISAHKTSSYNSSRYREQYRIE
ncbi:erg26, C-3 sterol dehydrogenase [Conoideocrella luteorostrata]|uniref:Erg26, C-3 sterol dehydrogenase n=1 Tax=Conoideocrella luteorostrata TaxID=1105319 RepID=A0AAJ0CJW2_9HYPO|nr:erg26, C-3 sterol dehydrogenase [Conoideocrella luteorostrata]